MNLKYQFYRAYYNGIDLRKFEDKEDQKAIENRNEPQFAKVNETLFREVEIGEHPFLEAFQTKWKEEFASFKLETTYPGLFLGSGYAHETGNVGEFKLGFHFDHATGLPALPGHSVKGVLRSAFPAYDFNLKKVELYPEEGNEEQEARTQFIAQLLGKEWPEEENETRRQLRALVHQLELALFERLDIPATLAADAAPKYIPQLKWILFFDAHITRKQENNPERKVILGPDAITPHGDNPLRNPIPLAFVKVLPKVNFTFAFRIPEIRLAGQVFKAEEITNLFEEILTTLGIGAKTNVGYGQLKKPGGKGNGAPLKNTEGKQPDKPPVPKPPQPPSVSQELSIEKVKRGAKVLGKVLDNSAGQIVFQLNVLGYDEPVAVKYHASNRFELGATYQLKIKEVQGKGSKKQLLIDAPSPNHKIV